MDKIVLTRDLTPMDFIVLTILLCMLITTIGFVWWLNTPEDMTVKKQCLSLCDKIRMINQTDNLWVSACVFKC
jgi:cell division protein FtsL